MKSAPACPHCDSARIKPQGTVVVLQGEVRAAYRCLACGRHFDLTVRAAANVGDRPDEQQ
jgi:DNA-directed RNA polymerase subunit RPC12/RpoP